MDAVTEDWLASQQYGSEALPVGWAASDTVSADLPSGSKPGPKRAQVAYSEDTSAMSTLALSLYLYAHNIACHLHCVWLCRCMQQATLAMKAIYVLSVKDEHAWGVYLPVQ